MNKAQILTYLLSELETKQSDMLRQIKDMQEARNSESKSSAGDKHETARAMAQNELEKYQQQIAYVQQDLNRLRQINAMEKLVKVGFGALVKTTQATFFFAISLGRININNQAVFCVSMASPIGQKAIGLKAGDSFSLNATHQQQIVEIT